MSYNTGVTNDRSMNGIITISDGNGTIIENGQITSSYSNINSSDVTNLAIDTNLTLDGTLTTSTNVISNLWISYLYGLTDNIQTQISAISSSIISSNNVWTGTNTFNNTATFNSTVNGLTKTTVGLPNVDNTSDINKPVSTSQQTALNLKANLASPTFTGTVSGITSSMVGLGNVDNTSDINKPVSTSQQTALNLKANLASPTFTGTVSGITKTMVGLGNVDNTSDINKPVSTATSTALALKADLSTPLINNCRVGYSASQQAYGGGSCGGLGGNLSGGNVELDFVNSGVNYATPTSYAFNWYILTSSTTKTLLADMRTNGNFTTIGTITSPTITTINSNIALKQDIINASNRLDASYIADGSVNNTEFQYINSLSSNCQNQINTANTNIATNTASIATNTASILTKQDIINASNRLDASYIADGSVNNTEFQYINSLTSNCQNQINTTNTNISTINTTLTGYATTFTTLNLIYERAVIGTDKITSGSSKIYTYLTIPSLTILQTNCNIQLPDSRTLTEGQIWTIFLMGGYSSTITVAGTWAFGVDSMWYSGGGHTSFGFSNSNKKKTFCVIDSMWVILED